MASKHHCGLMLLQFNSWGQRCVNACEMEVLSMGSPKGMEAFGRCVRFIFRCTIRIPYNIYIYLFKYSGDIKRPVCLSYLFFVCGVCHPVYIIKYRHIQMWHGKGGSKYEVYQGNEGIWVVHVFNFLSKTIYISCFIETCVYSITYIYIFKFLYTHIIYIYI